MGERPCQINLKFVLGEETMRLPIERLACRMQTGALMQKMEGQIRRSDIEEIMRASIQDTNEAARVIAQKDKNIKDLQLQKSVLEEENTARIKALEEENTARIKALEEENTKRIHNLTSQVSSLETKLQESKTTDLTVHSELLRLRQENKALKSEIHVKTQAYEDSNTTVLQQNKSHEELSAKIQTLENANSAFRKQVAVMKREHKSALKKKTDLLATAQADNAQLRQRVQNFNKTATDQQTTKEGLQAKLQEQAFFIAKLTESIKHERETKDAIQRELSKCTGSLLALEQVRK